MDQDDFLLEDDVEDGQQDVNALNRQLFGEDEEDNENLGYLGDRQEEQLEDELEDEDALVPAAAPAPAPAPGDVRAKLLQLAKKKKDREENESGKKRRKDKGEKGAKGEKGEKPSKKRKGSEDAGGKKSKRLQRAAEEEGEDAGGAAAAAPAGELEDVASEEIGEDDGDRAFIDDDGAEAVASEDDNEDERLANAEEAEEAEDDMDDVDKILKARKRKNKDRDPVNVDHEVKDMLSKMEAAAEHDFETVARNAGIELKRDAMGTLVTDAEGHFVVAGRGAPPKSKTPAVAKLQALKEVELFLAQRKFHESFIHQGGLGVLKGWLEPYVDHTLPNVRVRTSVLKSLQLLPLDTGLEDHKEILKRSQLGKNVMFLFKCGEEVKENKDMAKALVHKWCRPIFYDQEAEEEKKRLQQLQLLEARRLGLERRNKDGAGEGPAAQASRAKAVRIHAMIPQGSKLDYVNNPGAANDYSAPLDTGAPKGAKQVDFITKRIREVQRKTKDVGGRAMKPSVEGRNIVLTSG